MDRSLADEARGLVAAAREWVREFAEEGIARFEALDIDAAAKPASASPPDTAVPSEPLVEAPPALAEASPARAASAPTLEAVRAELGECTRCRLSNGRSRIVFGDGNPNAALMFIGEGPGQEEDRQGVPFVGRAGELLTRMIEKGLEIPRSEVYICNIVKCRPPNNRTPQPDEVSTCQPFLDGQIDAVRPRTIVTLGRPATSLLLGRDVSITRMRGQWQTYRGIPLMPTFHPAFLLRQYTAENRRAVWDDLKAALARSRE